MIMTLHEKYLGLYKTYESLLRDNGSEPRLVEQTLETENPGKAARLRMCRLFRNYLTHEDDIGFLEPTERMMDFLTAEVQELQYKDDAVRKHLRTPASCSFDVKVKCSDALAKILSGKLEYVVRVDGNNYDLIAAYDVMASYMESRTGRIGAVKAMKQKVRFIEPTAKYKTLDDSRVYICTSDGTSAGKFLGVVKF